MPRPVGELEKRILVCQGPSCRERGGLDAHHEWLLAARPRPWGVVPTACLRFCLYAPVSIVYPDAVWLPRLTGERVREAVRLLDRDQVRELPGAISAGPPAADGG